MSDDSRRAVPLPWRLSADEYHRLIMTVGGLSSTFGLVNPQSDHPQAEPGKTVLAELAPFWSESVVTSGWPGGGSGDPQQVDHYQAVPAAVTVLARRSDSFWDWVGPLMPADLHFLRDDGSVVLGTVPCEEYAWLEVDDQEFATITAALPSVRLGVFDPIDEMDAWLSAYRADFEDDGELTVLRSDDAAEGWQQAVVKTSSTTLSIRVHADGRVRVTCEQGSDKVVHDHQVSESSPLQTLFTSFFVDFGHASVGNPVPGLGSGRK